LKQKALDSAQVLAPSTASNQFKVPVPKKSLVTNPFIQSQNHSNTVTPVTTQTTISKTETPQNQNLTPSSKTALKSNTSMLSRTDKIMSSASIISSTVVNPPMDISKITNLFKGKPNISVIKTKPHEEGDKTNKDRPKEQFPKDNEEKKAPVNPNSRITKRRQTVCAENFYEMQKKAESQAGRKLGSFQPTILAVPKKIIKGEFDKKVDNKPAVIKQEKASQKRPAEEVIVTDKKKQKIDDHFTNQTVGKNQPQNKYAMRQRVVKTPEPEFQYWIKSKAKGYYIETFNTLDAANKYLEHLPKDATFGPLSDN